MEKSIKLTSLNRKEALRYLGYKKNAPDERVEELMDECEELVLKTAVPRFIYKKLDFTWLATVPSGSGGLRLFDFRMPAASCGAWRPCAVFCP